MFGTLTQQQAKDFARLHEKKHREAAGQLLLEGERLVGDVLRSDLRTEMLVIESEMASKYAESAYLAEKKGVSVLHCSARNARKLSDTPHPQGIFALVDMPATDPRAALDAAPADRPVFVLHGIADPGNLGTIMRTTEWFNGASLLLSADSVHPFNSKTLRGSMGSALRLNIGVYPDFDWLEREAERTGRPLVATAAEEGRAPADFPSANPIILLGSEAHGVASPILARTSGTLRIPGGGTESLNIAIAHAILAYAFSLK
ncbi:RNA methyltransferase [bacterium]|nr:RNA methyltransferase [bacterium]